MKRKSGLGEVFAFPGYESQVQRQEIDAEAYLFLVHRVARKISKRLPMHIDFNDLIGAGTLGLMRAAQAYDVQKCDKFEPYAEIRIRGAIIDELRAMDWVPRSLRQKSRRVEQAKSDLHQQLGREPDEEELSRHLGLQGREFQRLLRQTRAAAAQQPISEFNEPATSPDKNVDLCVARVEEKALLAKAIGTLQEREQQLLNMYYVDELSLKVIGETFGISESRVCQINTESIRKLRKRVPNIAREFHTKEPKRRSQRESSGYKLIKVVS